MDASLHAALRVAVLLAGIGWLAYRTGYRRGRIAQQGVTKRIRDCADVTWTQVFRQLPPEYADVVSQRFWDLLE